VKVAHLIPTLHSDGPEIGLVDLAGVARQADIDMVVVALSVSSDAAEVSALRRAGVPVAELDLFPWDPRAVARTAKLLREQRVEIVHTHLPQADVVGAAAAARNRIPAVSTLHRIHNEPADRVDRLKRSAKILARQRFMTRTIAISQVQREWYRSLAGPETDVLLVPNGVVDPGVPDEALRSRRRAALEVGEGDVVALSTAPMRRDQGHELLLDAVEALPDDLPLVLALAGEGPLRPWLESRVAATDALADRVRFTHRHREATELLAAADLFVHTASAAALPTGLLRAMAMGLPTVATRVGGIPEVITPDTGMLVALDPGAVVRALTSLTDDPARREKLGAGARARFLAEYDARAWARKLHDVYQSALDTWKSRANAPTNSSTAASGSGHTARP
jgi:glycosyltransferase involved in cell wall biosynthesis